MTAEELARLVKQMRELQTAYFRRRTPEALESSKQAEREVDKAVAAVLDRQRQLFQNDLPTR